MARVSGLAHSLGRSQLRLQTSSLFGQLCLGFRLTCETCWGGFSFITNPELASRSIEDCLASGLIGPFYRLRYYLPQGRIAANLPFQSYGQQKFSIYHISIPCQLFSDLTSTSRGLLPHGDSGEDQREDEAYLYERIFHCNL